MLKIRKIVFCFRKSYTSNRMETGFLQLSDRTHLVVDETDLQPGNLNSKGISIYVCIYIYNFTIITEYFFTCKNIFLWIYATKVRNIIIHFSVE